MVKSLKKVRILNKPTSKAEPKESNKTQKSGNSGTR
jgi:hypothetical protein